MRKLFVTLIVIAVLGWTGSAVAEDPNSPECEDSQRDPTTSGGKDRISERTHPIWAASGGSSGACEGEQWDGRDPVSSSCSPVSTAGAVTVNYNPSQGTDCAKFTQPDVNDNGAGDAVHVRASSTGSATFTHVGIWGVGIASAYAAAGGSGAVGAVYIHDYSESVFSATGATDEFDQAYAMIHATAYGGNVNHDHAEGVEGNLLASIVHFPHVTIGKGVGEERGGTSGAGNCTQDEYVNNDCVRDNTAVTVELMP